MSLLVAYTDGLVESGKNVLAGLAAVRAAVGDSSFPAQSDPAVTLFETIVGDRARDGRRGYHGGL